MTSKTKQIIMAAIGAYLVYTGISLVQDTIVGEPKNQILFILVGVFFALFGLATIIWNIRTIVKETKAEIQGTTAGAEENEDGEEAAKKVSSGKGVADVHVGADTKEEKSADKEERKETAAEEKAEDGEKEKKKAEDDTEAVKDEEKKTVEDKEDKKAEDVPEEKSDKKADARQEGEAENMRVGMGYDVHKLTEGRKLILGGVEIPYEKGLLGHSDADVLLHAIMDALLGAASLGDIGKHFPDTDPAYKGISSIKLLEHVGKLLDDRMYVIENIDATIIAQRPKMRPHIEQMEKNIAEALHIETNQVNVKATTEEGLGFTGSGEGISSQAICAIEKLTNFSSVDVAAPADGCAGCGGCAAKQM